MFLNISLFRLTGISLFNFLAQQLAILKPFNLIPYKIDLFYKLNFFSYNSIYYLIHNKRLNNFLKPPFSSKIHHIYKGK